MGSLLRRLALLVLLIVSCGYALKWFALSPVCESSEAIGHYVDEESIADKTILAPPSPKTKLPARKEEVEAPARNGTILFACKVAKTQLFWPGPTEIKLKIEELIYVNQT